MVALCLNQFVNKPRGEKLRLLLDREGHSPEWLATQLKVSKQTIYNWIEGAKPQKSGVWEIIGKLLNENFESIIDDSKEIPGLGKPLYPIPTLDVKMPRWPSLPANETWEYDPAECFDEEDIPSFLARRTARDPERICAYVMGTSMEPRLTEGDLVIIELEKSVRPGRIVLARSDKGRTLKVLRKSYDQQRYRLESINPEHGDAEAEQWELEGYLIAILRDYKKNRGNIEWDDSGIGP